MATANGSPVSSDPTTLPALDAQRFATDLLTGIGASPTTENVRLVGAWMSGEGTKAANNPLATTQPWTGATIFNTLKDGGHVWNYPDYSTGLAATKQTLTNGYYPGIVSDLQSGNYTADQIVSRNWDEFNTWGTGGAGVQANLNANNLFATKAYGVAGSPQSGGIGSDIKKVLTWPGSSLPSGPIPGVPTAGGIASFLGANTITKDVAYALAIAGGGLLVLLGFALIGIDLGLSKAKPQTIIVAPLQRRRENRSDYRSGQRQAERAATRRAGRQGRSSPKANNASEFERKQRIQSGADSIPDDIPY